MKTPKAAKSKPPAILLMSPKSAAASVLSTACPTMRIASIATINVTATAIIGTKPDPVGNTVDNNTAAVGVNFNVAIKAMTVPTVVTNVLIIPLLNPA